MLDGATGTELGRRGVDISPPLWSARALLEAPDVLERIHREYLAAGARAITTCTFRTHQRSLAKAGMTDPWRDLTLRAVEIAVTARDAENPDALVLGSVAPLEDCYQPHLSPPAEQCAMEHRAMIAALLEAGVDAILIETMPAAHEALAAAAPARDLAGGKWIISLLPRSTGPPGVLLDGSSIVDLLAALSDANAIGVNCVAAPAMERQVRLLRSLLPPGQRIIAYANTAVMDETGRFSPTDAEDPWRYAEYALSWRNAGASLIGGCCGTTPQTIRAMTALCGSQ